MHSFFRYFNFFLYLSIRSPVPSFPPSLLVTSCFSFVFASLSFLKLSNANTRTHTLRKEWQILRGVNNNGNVPLKPGIFFFSSVTLSFSVRVCALPSYSLHALLIERERWGIEATQNDWKWNTWFNFSRINNKNTYLYWCRCRHWRRRRSRLGEMRVRVCVTEHTHYTTCVYFI